MAGLSKVLRTIMGGRADANIRFGELCRLVAALGFQGRIRGSHHVFSRDGVIEIINLQAGPGGKAKPYQVRQVRQLVEKYELELNE